MTDTPVCVVANLKIHDAETYRRYEQGFFPILKKHGGRLLSFDDAPDSLEGDVPREGRVVLASFPSEAAARAWYEDPDYQALSEHRRAGTTLEFLTLIRGLPPRE
jgi:uncharacterized protein (DUF1330 family)